MRTASRVRLFQESVIREMTRIAHAEGAINLSQGIPDLPAPAQLKSAAARAIGEDHNQYSFTYGSAELRRALSRKLAKRNSIRSDPEDEITVTCGVSEGIVSTCLALLDPGDEAIVFEPFYENYLPAVHLAGAVPVTVSLTPGEWRLDMRALRGAITKRTRAVIVNTPMNPTGKVFTRDELEDIAALCTRHDLIAVTDEIYEDIIYEDTAHVSLASLDAMADRTVTVMGFSKTYGVTGWRVGYVAAARPLSEAIRKVHDYATVCAPTPLQEAVLAALALPDDYYDALRSSYTERRDLFCCGLLEMGFKLLPPAGAYYVLADFSALSGMADREFAQFLVREGGVASVPGGSFFSKPADGTHLVRFSFAPGMSTLKEALERIGKRLRELG